MKHRFNKLMSTPMTTSLLFALLALSGCNQTINKDNSEQTSIPINSFENDADLSILSSDNTIILPVNETDNKGITDGQKAIKVDFLAKYNYEASFSLKPEEPWHWDSLGNFRVAVDITNNSDDATHLFVFVKDKKGQGHNRSVNVPAHSSHTYHIELAGLDLNVNSGIRSNPVSWKTDEKPFIWRGGVQKLDVSAITAIKFSVNGLLKDRTLIFDNLRALQTPKTDKQYLANLVDKYGQRYQLKTPYSISSDEELKQISQDELATLDGKLMADRSRFGGWKNGPKLKATGYFRTEKIGDTWSLVDPDGYLYFSTGIDNVRMANTSTITGIDFDPKLIKQREKGDLTPEDSLGLNPVSKTALKTQYVASELRRNMFTWLPKYDEPLAKHYGYRRTVHTGALKHGETYSFYQANLERKYGEHYLDKWLDVTVKRMINWGFTSFGNWIDPMFYQDDRVPYFANGWIIGHFKTVSSGNDVWSPLPDPFDPVFVERAKATIEQIGKEVKNNPWCVGVFIDNEKSWGHMGKDKSHYAISINTLKFADEDSPTKAHFTQMMKKKYQDIHRLNVAWNTDIKSWQAFSAGVDLTEYTQAQLVDFSNMLKAFANEYFSVVNHELKRVMPNHMYMGVRLASWGMSPEVIAAAADNVDVMSYNVYKEGIQPNFWKFLKDVDMPSIIGEFHMGAMDTGLLNPGLIHAETQQDRAKQYTNYMHSVIDNPYFIGAHWFQYIDSPLTGRAYDGENYNVGFVSVTDTPYQPMVDAVKKVNSELYPRRFPKVLAKEVKDN